MAKNLQWLAESRYPHEKIIVWAANAHIMKNTNTALKSNYKNIGWMGTVFNQSRRNAQQTYIIGFASQQGTYRRVGAAKTSIVQKPIKNGFETWINNDLLYGFIDWEPFRQLNPNYNEMFIMKGMGQYSATAAWTNIFDGVFYIREMPPCGALQVNRPN